MQYASGALSNEWLFRPGPASGRIYVPMIFGVGGAGACPNQLGPFNNARPIWTPLVRRAARAESRPTFRPRVVVVALGADDALSPSVDRDCLLRYERAAIDPLLSAIAASFPRASVIWVNQRTNLPDRTTDLWMSVVNDALRSAQTHWPRLWVADFSARFGRHPEWFYDASNVHLDPGGQLAYATWLRHVLDRTTSAPGHPRDRVIG